MADAGPVQVQNIAYRTRPGTNYIHAYNVEIPLLKLAQHMINLSHVDSKAWSTQFMLHSLYTTHMHMYTDQ